MRLIRFLFLIILAVLLLSTCEEFDPQWAGVWVDDTTVPKVVITLDFNKWSGSLTVENNNPTADAKLTIVEGSLDGDENTLIARITSIYQEYWDGRDPVLMTDQNIIILYVTLPPDPGSCPGCLGIKWPCSAVYNIVGDTITLTGDIILALTENVSNTLTATRQP
jgi:hypothetical protein